MIALNFRVQDLALAIDYSDGSTRVVPFDWFIPGGSGTKPDFNDIEIIDDGLTLRLGEYEADLVFAYEEHEPV